MKAKDILNALLPKPPETIDDLRAAVSEAAQLSYESGALEEKKAAAVAKTNEIYGGEIATLNKRFNQLVTSIKNWATKNRADFDGKQSVFVDDHELRFRLSTGKLTNPAKDADLVDTIIATGDLELIEVAINPKPTLDKVAIKAVLESGSGVADKLLHHGFTVEKAEDFSFIPARPKTGSTTL